MNNTELKRSAARALATADYSPARLALIHTGVALLVTLLSTLVSYLLTRQINATTGLAALGSRTALTMAQTILNLVTTALLPFWSIGILRAGIDYARGASVTPGCLLAGFRRWKPMLRLMLLRVLLLMAICFACMQVAMVLYMQLMFTPLGASIVTKMEAALPAIEGGSVLNPAMPDPATITPETVKALLPFAIPVYVLFFGGFFALGVPIMYRLRLADYLVMDGCDKARLAMKESGSAMRGKKMQLFRLDLSFWWYFALQLLCAGISYGDKLLPLLGIPVNTNAAFWLFYGISLIAQLATACAFLPKYQTTQAMFYLNAFPRGEGGKNL